MNDSLRTNVFVRFQPETIACACIYLAARALQVSGVLPFCGCLLLEVPFQEDSENACSVSHDLQLRFLLHFQIPLPTRPHWFLLFGTTEEEIQEICLTTLKLYTRKKVPSWCVCVLGWWLLSVSCVTAVWECWDASPRRCSCEGSAVWLLLPREGVRSDGRSSGVSCTAGQVVMRAMLWRNGMEIRIAKFSLMPLVTLIAQLWVTG